MFKRASKGARKAGTCMQRHGTERGVWCLTHTHLPPHSTHKHAPAQSALLRVQQVRLGWGEDQGVLRIPGAVALDGPVWCVMQVGGYESVVRDTMCCQAVRVSLVFDHDVIGHAACHPL